MLQPELRIDSHSWNRGKLMSAGLSSLHNHCFSSYRIALQCGTMLRTQDAAIVKT